MARTRICALSTIALGGLLCSGGLAVAADESSKPPRQVLADAQAAMAKVKSFHIEGFTVDDDGRTEIAADITASGSADLRLRNRTGVARVRVVGSKQVFYRANAAFWRSSGAPSATATRLADRWVKMPGSSSDARELTQQFDPRTIGYCLARGIGTLSKRVETVDGQKTVVLIDKGDKPGTGPGRLYVAATGPARVVRLVQTGPKRKGGKPDRRCDEDGGDGTRSSDARITRYDRPVRIVAPRDALDLSKLQGGTRTSTV